MGSMKLEAGHRFPTVTVPKFGGGQMQLGKTSSSGDWQLVIVYRGKHCPICTRYLSEVNDSLEEFNKIGVEVVAVSADTLERANEQLPALNLNFPVGYDLSIENMRELGLYISAPRSETESDRPFSEPGHFVINAEGMLQLTDISNAPFARPAVASLVAGLGYIKDPKNEYPIRGTYQDD